MSEPHLDPIPALGLFEGFGVELEYMIVDRKGLHVRPIADRILVTAEGEVTDELDQGDLAWSNELVSHVLELKTNGPVPELADLDKTFHKDIRRINERLYPMGARLMPSAAHPFMDPYVETKLWPHDNSTVYKTFDRIFNCRGHGWSNLQSVHLNLPFKGNDEFARLHSAIRLVLPIVPAIAAASPYLDGKDTGLLDSRLEMYRRNCSRIFSVTAHVVPEALESMEDYQREILQPIYRDLAPFDPEGILRYEWANARGAIARFDRQTIEIRVVDIQECPMADIAILMGLSRVIRQLAFNPEALALGDRLSAQRLSGILLDAVQSGGHATIVDTEYLAGLALPEKKMEACEAWSGLMEKTQDIPDTYRRVLDFILREGTLAARMKKITGECTREHLLETSKILCDCLEENRLLIP